MQEDIENKRRTNKLLRAIFGHLSAGNHKLSAEEIHALCALTWWGMSDSANERNKIRLLGQLLGKNFKGMKIEEVSKVVASELKEPSTRNLVLGKTGFTRFYAAYRNSSLIWLKRNLKKVSSLVRQAYELTSDEGGEKLVTAIEKLEKIAGVGRGKGRRMNPAYLLTPLLFALDPRLRFPIMNGAKDIARFFKENGVNSGSAEEQYWTLIGLYERGGVEDAAHLDFLLRDKSVLSRNQRNRALKTSVARYGAGDDRSLTNKDDGDFDVLKAAVTEKRKRLHNRLTNSLLETLQDRFVLEEGGGSNKFDVIVREFDRAGNDLLIEAKSSIDISEVRMAIGQLYSYWFNRYGGKENHRWMAVLLPDHPLDDVVGLLRWLDIGLLWFDKGRRLRTDTGWLKELCKA